ncbi:MAG: hypothetical protein HYW05_02780 [Candidatus Diapherotrites archaeon]|nr:hypothetical protein [Candidatus Diapherotrites archaeon]
MLNKKAQAALEYLTTYGFALVVIAVVIGVLIFMGIIKIPTAGTCTGLEKLAYEDHALDANGNLALYLSNGTGYKITDISAGASGDFNAGSICAASASAVNSGADFNIACSNTGISEGQSYNGIITIAYKRGRLGLHSEKANCTGTGSGAAVIGISQPQQQGTLYLNSKFYDATMYNNSRKLARSADGATLYLVYEDGNGTKPDVYFTQSADNGSSWSATINLSDNSGASRFPAIAAASDGTIHVVWDDDTAFGIPKQEIFYKQCSGSCTSIDNWSADLNISRTGNYSSILPSVSMDSDNNANVVWQEYESGVQNEIYYKRCASNCGNYANWGAAANLSNNATYSNNPAIAISADGNRHVAWHDNNGQWDIWYKTCKYDCTNASKWSGAVDVSNNSSGSQYPSIAADSGNNVHIAWQDEPKPGNTEILYKSCPSGNDCSGFPGWGADFNVSSMLNYSMYPSIAADSGNNAYVVWVDRNANNNYDIFYRKRNSSGIWDGNLNKTSNNLGNSYPSLRVSSAPGARIEYVWTYGTAADYNVLYYGENV